MDKVVNVIGVEATLEQCAEECSELSQACLKMARKLRGDNPTPKTMEEINNDLHEEIADVLVCIDVLYNAGVLSAEHIHSIVKIKSDRWLQRLDERKKK